MRRAVLDQRSNSGGMGRASVVYIGQGLWMHGSFQTASGGPATVSVPRIGMLFAGALLAGCSTYRLSPPVASLHHSVADTETPLNDALANLQRDALPNRQLTLG
jgi:hypothetical protein